MYYSVNCSYKCVGALRIGRDLGFHLVVPVRGGFDIVISSY